jgi:hypothetical protein
MAGHKIYEMPFSIVYPHYINKAERKTALKRKWMEASAG